MMVMLSQIKCHATCHELNFVFNFLAPALLFFIPHLERLKGLEARAENSNSNQLGIANEVISCLRNAKLEIESFYESEKKEVVRVEHWVLSEFILLLKASFNFLDPLSSCYLFMDKFVPCRNA